MSEKINKIFSVKVCVSVLIAILIASGIYFLVNTTIKTKKLTETNTRNIETIVNFLNQTIQND